MRVVFLALLLVAGRAPATNWPPDRAVAAIPPFPTVARLPAIEGPRAAPLVVIDGGHGGHDPGSTARNGTHEKTIALAVAQAIRAALLDGGGVRVALTRNDDHFLVLTERREIGRALNAALFLSVHCDSTANPAIHGASLYTLSPRSTDQAANAVASRENRADVVNGVDLAPEATDLSAILTDLARRETRVDSIRLAQLLGRSLKPLGILKADYQRAAALKVLRAPDVPSVLLEAGYISNASDLRRLSSAHGRAALARAIASAIRAFLAERHR